MAIPSSGKHSGVITHTASFVSGWPSVELAREMSELELAHQPRPRPTSPVPEPMSPPLRRRHSDDATTLFMGTPRSSVDVDGWSVATSSDLPTPERTESEDTPQQRPRKRARQDSAAGRDR